MPKFGDTVKYSEFGKDFNALVVEERHLEHHHGENDEPLLTLVIVKPITLDECLNCHYAERQHGKPFAPGARSVPCATFVAPAPIAPANPSECVKVVADVPHDSHEFSEENILALQKQGITFSAVYPGGQIPGGRWSEISKPEAVAVSEARTEETPVVN